MYFKAKQFHYISFFIYFYLFKVPKTGLLLRDCSDRPLAKPQCSDVHLTAVKSMSFGNRSYSDDRVEPSFGQSTKDLPVP